MIRSLFFVFVVLAFQAQFVSAADLAPKCRQPQRPLIPDGADTTEEALVRARTRLETYLKLADGYLACLRTFEKEMGEAITEVDGHELVVRYNAVVDDMYLAGDEFNVAIRRFTGE